jgi:hypothetical protein
MDSAYLGAVGFALYRAATNSDSREIPVSAPLVGVEDRGYRVDHIEKVKFCSEVTTMATSAPSPSEGWPACRRVRRRLRQEGQFVQFAEAQNLYFEDDLPELSPVACRVANRLSESLSWCRVQRVGSCPATSGHLGSLL